MKVRVRVFNLTYLTYLLFIIVAPLFAVVTTPNKYIHVGSLSFSSVTKHNPISSLRNFLDRSWKSSSPPPVRIFVFTLFVACAVRAAADAADRIFIALCASLHSMLRPYKPTQRRFPFSCSLLRRNLRRNLAYLCSTRVLYM